MQSQYHNNTLLPSLFPFHEEFLVETDAMPATRNNVGKPRKNCQKTITYFIVECLIKKLLTCWFVSIESSRIAVKFVSNQHSS